MTMETSIAKRARIFAKSAPWAANGAAMQMQRLDTLQAAAVGM